MIIVVCLGNVGWDYEKTWHNAGWIVADQIVPTEAWEFNKYAYADIAVIGEIVWVKPRTMMNNSGEVLEYLDKRYQVGGDNLVIIYDDLDLPAGSLKTSHNRGAGGHNGIRSIVAHFGSQAFTRVRIGVAPVTGRTEIPGDFRDYVLRNMDESDLNTIKGLAPKVQNIIATIQESGYAEAMNRWN